MGAATWRRERHSSRGGRRSCRGGKPSLRRPLPSQGASSRWVVCGRVQGGLCSSLCVLGVLGQGGRGEQLLVLPAAVQCRERCAAERGPARCGWDAWMRSSDIRGYAGSCNRACSGLTWRPSCPRCPLPLTPPYTPACRTGRPAVPSSTTTSGSRSPPGTAAWCASPTWLNWCPLQVCVVTLWVVYTCERV